MKKVLLFLVLIIAMSCTKEKIVIDPDVCYVCEFPSSPDQFKTKRFVCRTQDNYFVWEYNYLCDKCGNTYELYKKEKIK